MEVRQVFRVFLEGFRHLDGQFTGRCQHHYLRLAGFQVEATEQRQREGRGLAGAGLGLAEHVAAVHDVWNHRSLDRRGRLITQRNQGFENGFRQAHVTEGGGGAVGGFGSHRRVSALGAGAKPGKVV